MTNSRNPKLFNKKKLILFFHNGTKDMDPFAIANIRQLRAPCGLENDPSIQYLISIREEILRREEAEEGRRIAHG